MGTTANLSLLCEVFISLVLAFSIKLNIYKMNNLVKQLVVIPRNVQRLQVVPKRNNTISGYARNPISTAEFIAYGSIQAVSFFGIPILVLCNIKHWTEQD